VLIAAANSTGSNAAATITEGRMNEALDMYGNGRIRGNCGCPADLDKRIALDQFQFVRKR
jgi:hypothetical protein